MKVNDYLLTFSYDGYQCFSWFETEEEMNEYVRERGDKIEVLEKIHIIESRAV